MVRLKSRLAEAMKARRGDLSQRDFAKKIGLAQSTVMRIENQNQNVTLDTLERLCTKFKCDVGALFDDPTKERP